VPQQSLMPPTAQLSGVCLHGQPPLQALDFSTSLIHRGAGGTASS